MGRAARAQPEQAREGVAKDDGRLEQRELLVERPVPIGRVRIERIGQVGVGHALPALPQPPREPGLPVVGARALQAMQDEECATWG